MIFSSSFQKEERKLQKGRKNSFFLLNNRYPALYSNVSALQMKISEIQEKLKVHKCSKLPAVVQLMNISPAIRGCYKTMQNKAKLMASASSKVDFVIMGIQWLSNHKIIQIQKRPLRSPSPILIMYFKTEVSNDLQRERSAEGK